MAMDIDALKNEVWDDVVAAGFGNTNLAGPTLKKLVDVLVTSIINHIIDKAEVKTVPMVPEDLTKTPSPIITLETYSAGVGSYGGTLTSDTPVVGNVKSKLGIQ